MRIGFGGIEQTLFSRGKEPVNSPPPIWEPMSIPRNPKGTATGDLHSSGGLSFLVFPDNSLLATYMLNLNATSATSPNVYLSWLTNYTDVFYVTDALAANETLLYTTVGAGAGPANEVYMYKHSQLFQDKNGIVHCFVWEPGMNNVAGQPLKLMDYASASPVTSAVGGVTLTFSKNIYTFDPSAVVNTGTPANRGVGVPVRTANGRILLPFTRDYVRTGDYYDYKPAFALSDDEGETWTIITPAIGDSLYNSGVPLSFGIFSDGGTEQVVFPWKKSTDGQQVFLVSTDQGDTWIQLPAFTPPALSMTRGGMFTPGDGYVYWLSEPFDTYYMGLYRRPQTELLPADITAYNRGGWGGGQNVKTWEQITPTILGIVDKDARKGLAFYTPNLFKPVTGEICITGLTEFTGTEAYYQGKVAGIYRGITKDNVNW